MKLKSATPLLFLLSFSGPTPADTAPHPLMPADCPMTGHQSSVTEECQVFRLAYRSEVTACMNLLNAQADARAGRATKLNAHSYRARFTICDTEVRTKLEMASK